MTKRFLTLLAAGTMAGTLGAAAASAESLPAQNECAAYMQDLEHNLMLLGPHAAVDPDVLLAMEAAERMKVQGQGDGCSDVSQAAIASLGLPVRNR